MTQDLPASPYIMGVSQAAASSASLALTLATWFPLVLALGSLLLFQIIPGSHGPGHSFADLDITQDTP